jgi:NAD(P)-dependent dehydrogenase (short-subunit alcohol dehydrogenase family)
MDLELAGRRAVITGGNRGIGREIALALTGEGVDVMLAARDGTRLEAVARELGESSGRKVFAQVCDTGDTESVRQLARAAQEQLGGVDILVNAAARTSFRRTPPGLLELTDEDFWDDVNVKVLGYLRCARAIAPGMIEQGWGRIINVSGLNARTTGNLVGSVRNISVSALTKNLADELGRFGINVTAVHPGFTLTDTSRAVISERAAQQDVSAEEIGRQMFTPNAIGRAVEAAEVASLVTFLASPKSSAITGDSIACGGGQLGPIHY